MTPARVNSTRCRKGAPDAAADPDVSVFVSANAGSGKTHVLAQRVINLLLRGDDPAKILCITFTKAAAANMATRVFDTLAEWTTLDDAALDERIRLATGKTAGCSPARACAAAVRQRAGDAGRTESADHPRLLHPAAAPVPVRGRCRGAFRVLDEAATAQMLNQLTLDVLLEGATKPDSAARQGAGHGHRGRRRCDLQGRDRRNDRQA